MLVVPISLFFKSFVHKKAQSFEPIPAPTPPRTLWSSKRWKIPPSSAGR